MGIANRINSKRYYNMMLRQLVEIAQPFTMLPDTTFSRQELTAELTKQGFHSIKFDESSSIVGDLVAITCSHEHGTASHAVWFTFK